MILNNHKAFTLAEVLITLMIIGIISSIVIPALIQDSQNIEFRTAWKKSFADISNASKLVSQEYAGNLTGTCSSHVCIRDLYKTYFSYTRLCNGSTDVIGNCWNTDGAKGLNGGTVLTPAWFGGAALAMNNGQFFYFETDASACNPICYRFVTDINGFKGPNTMGKDIYYAYIFNNGVVKPKGYDTTLLCPSGNGYDCSTKYLYSN
ncbi:MAG: prepilin-type N-terminal cleavage/methylation domain-containing protein [Candidatus Gastranaerophilales bacterium]|nr:prepilin-type N-terminal cleavage/methylation domain-containing protein [Candidatus Gastranaerophilales bacterium]